MWTNAVGCHYDDALFQDGGRLPSWILILGYNSGVDQRFCTKFGTVMENREPKGTMQLLRNQVLENPRSKMADGRHLEFKKDTIIES